ncbi:maleylpyruvate isomerase family mycothiol-dependent enzyme [Gordonia sp. LSe1-13]|uniref:Maleylpyruvate isomerase family mycothiol-dependent enzyme n=1 Tax=Gordonia sesuvii TaxID=3116777 RepID=A0ABU7MFC4_9ACTN|nr:maleylpyruvate isomerase family mycothiol-dependent enzyme [Gordonia sp. LSe1-13]
MNDDEIFAAIADERRRLADLAATFTDEQWATASLCDGWTCRDVMAHLLVPLVVSIPAAGLAMLRARGNFHRANLAMAAKVKATYPDLPRALRDKADTRFTPPGRQGPRAPLTDIIVHGLDIRRPLGIAATTPPDRTRVVLDFLVNPVSNNMFGKVPSAVRWVATDLDWAAGAGPVVEGSSESLLLALTGRPEGMAELAGEGLQELT